MYREYPPDIMLSGLVDTCWVSEAFTASEERTRILPDGCVDIIVSAYNTQGMKAFRPYIAGTATTYIEPSFSGKHKMIGIRFKPGSITAFTKVPIHAFTDSSVDIALAETLFDDRFCEELQAREETCRQLRFINDYLLNKFAVLYPVDRQVTATVNLITQTCGTVPVKQLLERVCLCQRQFERRFKASVGVSPKMFSRIVRFNHTRHQLKAHPRQSLLDTAVDCGYYDHAHLIKDFMMLSGNSPAVFY